MSLGSEEIGIDNDTPKEKGGNSIPDSLKEFGKAPPNYKSVYVEVDRNNVKSIGVAGIDPKFRAERLPSEAVEIDNLIKKAANEQGKNIDRLGSVFAYPEDPNIVPPVEYYGNRGNQITLEIKVDPDKCFVADASAYGTISSERGYYPTRTDMLHKNIKTYVDSAVPLSLYDDSINFTQPEVLIPGILSTDLIRVVKQD